MYLLNIATLLQTSATRIDLECACQSGDIVGDFVYVSGVKVGGRPSVSKADITDYSKMPAIGVITEKLTDTICKVNVFGLWDLGFGAGLIPNSHYFLGFDSQVTTTKPLGTESNPVFIQSLGIAIDEETILLQPSFLLTKVIS